MTRHLRWQGSPFVAPAVPELDRTLGDLLRNLAAASPGATAVIDGERRVSFAELAGLAGGLARQIVEVDAPAGPVALIQPLGVAVVAAWFACSLAGRPLLLLEPHNPIARNVELVRIADAKIAIGGVGEPALAGLAAIVPDGRIAPLRAGSGLGSADPAMIFPTSGSTGEPKLVAYSTQTLLAKALASRLLMDVDGGEIVLIAGSHGNFGFLHHALVFLLAGGTICLLDPRKAGLGGLFATIRDQGVSHVRFTPSLFRAAAEVPEAEHALRALRGVRFSGEPLSWNDVGIARRMLDPSCRIQNVYGSTESAIFIWTDDRSLPIGQGVAPIGRIYPLWEYAIRPDEDGAGQPDEHGAGSTDPTEGGLIVRSAYQALGDWRAGAIDGGRFPADPAASPLRLYDTGDVVRRTDDGDLSMLGRSDRLVKVNGFRVSLPEVEAHIRAVPGCSQAAVIAVDGARGISLAAFYTRQGDGILPADYRAWLAGRLPAPMAPARLLEVDALPLLPGGKLDYRGLAALVERAAPLPATDPSVAAMPDDLSRLRLLWNEALDSTAAADDPDRDFFDLGGDSLRLLQLGLAIERSFCREIDPDAFLDRPTLRSLARVLRIDEASALPKARKDGALAFRLVRSASGESRGVALAMPGWSGGQHIRSWTTIEALSGFDIWTCTLSIHSGNMMQGGRWFRTARAIAAAIEAGQCPAPTIVFGFSIAGYIAWLVDRLLAGKPGRPEHVICLDTAPLHRQPRHARRDVGRIATRDIEPGRMLLIRRAPLRRMRAAVPAATWLRSDAHLSVVEVRTLEHADMDTPGVLTAVDAAIHAFVGGGHPPECPTGIAVSTPSSRIYDIVSDGLPLTATDVQGLRKDLPSKSRTASLSVIRYLEVACGGPSIARDAIGSSIDTDTNAFVAHYATVSLRDVARGRWIAPNTIRRDAQIGSLAAVDEAVSMRSDTGHHPGGRALRHVAAYGRRLRAAWGVAGWLFDRLSRGRPMRRFIKAARIATFALHRRVSRR